MDFADEILRLSDRLPDLLDYMETEEATKTALIIPFIRALGWDVYDPREVKPEFCADVGTKRGEKVDYAIMLDGDPIILIEAKWSGDKLADTHTSQLYRYFSVTTARIGILTNGIEYRFFTDTNEPNVMDLEPYFAIDMRTPKKSDLAYLKSFSKPYFKQETVGSSAKAMKYTRGIKRVFAEQLTAPDDELVRFFAKKFYSGRISQNILNDFRHHTRQALRQFVSERITDRLQVALTQEDEAGKSLETENATSRELAAKPAETDPSKIIVFRSEDGSVVTTQEEVNGYELVRSLVESVVATERVTMRDAKSYCAVLLDDNNRKPICRLWFNRGQKYISLFDAAKNEKKVAIDSVNELQKYAEALCERAQQAAGCDSSSGRVAMPTTASQE